MPTRQPIIGLDIGVLRTEVYTQVQTPVRF